MLHWEERNTYFTSKVRTFLRRQDVMAGLHNSKGFFEVSDVVLMIKLGLVLGLGIYSRWLSKSNRGIHCQLETSQR